MFSSASPVLQDVDWAQETQEGILMPFYASFELKKKNWM